MTRTLYTLFYRNHTNIVQSFYRNPTEYCTDFLLNITRTIHGIFYFKYRSLLTLWLILENEPIMADKYMITKIYPNTKNCRSPFEALLEASSLDHLEKV